MPALDLSNHWRRARETGEDLAMALRLARDLPGYLRTTITLDAVYTELTSSGDEEDDGLTPEQRKMLDDLG